MTQEEYNRPIEQVKYWNEYYWDCYKPLINFKKELKAKSKGKDKGKDAVFLNAKSIGYILQEKGAYLDANRAKDKNLFGINMDDFDGIIFPYDEAGIELFMDIGTWGEPGWSVKQNMVPRCANINPKDFLALDQEIYKLLCRVSHKYALDECIGEKFASPYITNYFGVLYHNLAQIRRLNIPMITEEAALLSKIMIESMRTESMLGGVLQVPSLSEGRAMYDAGTLQKLEKENEGRARAGYDYFSKPCIFTCTAFFCDMQKGTKRPEGLNGYTKEDRRYISPISRLEALDEKHYLNFPKRCEIAKKYAEWGERLEKKLRDELIRKYARTYSPYVDSEKRAAWTCYISDPNAIQIGLLGEKKLRSHAERRRPQLHTLRSFGVLPKKDYVIWGKPRWCVKQETLRRYPESRLKIMNTKELARIIHELVDKAHGEKKGYCAHWIEHVEEKKNIFGSSIAQIYYISYLNIPVISEEARIYAKSMEGIAFMREHEFAEPGRNGSTIIDRQNIGKNPVTLEEARKRLLEGTLPTKHIYGTPFPEAYMWDFLVNIKAYKGRSGNSAYTWTNADWYCMNNNIYGLPVYCFTGTDEWDTRFKEPLRQSLVKRYGGIYSPYADKEKKEAWAKMIEEGMTWTDLYEWRILPPCLRGKYNVEKEMGTEMKKRLNYKMEEHRHRWDEVNSASREWWERVKIP